MSRQGDADGDGVSNFKEYLFGSDPRVYERLAAKPFIVVSASNTVLSWPTGPQHRYSVEWTTNFTQWAGTGSNYVGSGGWINHSSARTGSNMFWRVRATEAPDSNGDGYTDWEDAMDDSADSDGDGMPNGYEMRNGLDISQDDTLDDRDGDGVVNVLEYRLGTAAGNRASRPVHAVGSKWGARHYLVDSVSGAQNSEDNIFATLTEAGVFLSSSGLDMTLVDMVPGTHVGSASFAVGGRTVQVSGATAPAVLVGENNKATVSVTAGTLVMEGLTLTHRQTETGSETGRGLEVSGGTGSRARLINCVIRGNREVYGAGVRVQTFGSRVDLVHTTVFDNVGTATSSNSERTWGRGLSILNGGTINVINSISWNPALAGDTQQETGWNSSSSASYDIKTSYVRDVANPSQAAPGLNYDGHLTAGSPAIDAATTPTGQGFDLDGEARPRGANADMGADEYVDADSDSLPDFFETAYFGNLAATASGDADADRLTNYYEYVFGYDPTNSASSGDPLGDCWAAVTDQGKSYYPPEWLLDGDSDALPTWREIYLGTNPADADTNHDGILDGPSVEIGLDPLKTDHDGDGSPNAEELLAGTDPFEADTDRDGVNDPADAFPLDPFASSFNPVPGDVAAPVIQVHQPPDAVKL